MTERRPYVAHDPTWWDSVLSQMRRAGPLEVECVYSDLRHLQDEAIGRWKRGKSGKLPSLRVLADRWGWLTDDGEPAIKRVRTVLRRDAEVWQDAYKAEAWTRIQAGEPYRQPVYGPVYDASLAGMGTTGAGEGHDEGTAGARRGHSRGTPETEEPEQLPRSGHDEGTGGAQEGHDRGHRRAVPPDTVPPSTSTTEDTDTPRDARGRVLQLVQVDPHLPLPPWMAKQRKRRRVPASLSSADVARVVHAAVCAVRSRPPATPADVPEADARPVLALWSEMRWPPPAEAEQRLLRLAWAARHGQHDMFRRAIRGEGWVKSDSSGQVSAVYRLSPPDGSQGATWSEREAQAEVEEHARDRPGASAAPGGAWGRILASMPRGDVDAWLRQLEVVEEPGRLALVAPNRHHAMYVLDELLPAMEQLTDLVLVVSWAGAAVAK